MRLTHIVRYRIIKSDIGLYGDLLMNKRRNFLKILGGGTVLAATGAGVFLGSRTPERALTPWTMAGD